MWDIKQEATNKQAKQTNTQTDNRMVFTRQEGEEREDEESKRDQLYDDGKRLDFGW